MRHPSLLPVRSNSLIRKHVLGIPLKPIKVARTNNPVSEVQVADEHLIHQKRTDLLKLPGLWVNLVGSGKTIEELLIIKDRGLNKV
jgi:hypothetical protein